MNLSDYFHQNAVEQQVFAEKVGISKSLLSRIKNGTRKPRVEIAKKIEKATGGKVKAAVLLGLVKK
jgi:transcriptional regulator with XRE-family HTH domain